MKSFKDIEHQVTTFNVNPRSEMRSKVFDEALKVQRNQKQTSTSDTNNACIGAASSWLLATSSRRRPGPPKDLQSVNIANPHSRDLQKSFDKRSADLTEVPACAGMTVLKP